MLLSENVGECNSKGKGVKKAKVQVQEHERKFDLKA